MAVAAEQLGYSAFWFGEAPATKEAFTHAATLLAATEQIQVATGIANICARDAVAAANGAATLADAWPGRFVLGPRGEPRAAGAAARARVRQAARDHARLSRCHGRGGVLSAAGRGAATACIAALRPKMLELAKTRAQGAHTYFATPEHTARARAALGEEPILATEQAVVLDTDPARPAPPPARTPRRHLRLPNYLNHLRELGFAGRRRRGRRQRRAHRRHRRLG